jgi:hypothetical protein
METNIPFGGFYNTLWDTEIDSLEEQQVEYMLSSDCDEDWSELEEGEIQEVLFKHTDHSSIFKAIAEMYVEAWADFINEELDLDIQLDFSTMTSPKEYNFTTDRVFAEISRDDIAKIYKKVGRHGLRDKAKEMFTSRSGFISFYSPHIEEWGPVREWDYNQLGCLMEALDDMAGKHGPGARHDNELAIYYDLNEKISNAYQENVDWTKVESELKHLIDVKNGEAEMDARRFPGRDVTGMREYVQKFEELNRLKGA